MSDLYARIPTSARKTVPTARGLKSTGISAEVCSWEGKIVSEIKYEDWMAEDGTITHKYIFEVRMEPHHGTGDSLLLATGVVGDKDPARAPFTFEYGEAVNY